MFKELGNSWTTVVGQGPDICIYFINRCEQLDTYLGDEETDDFTWTTCDLSLYKHRIQRDLGKMTEQPRNSQSLLNINYCVQNYSDDNVQNSYRRYP